MPVTFFDWIVLFVKEYGPLFLSGAGTTLLLALIGTAAGFVLGLLVAIVRAVPLAKDDSLLKRVFMKIVNALLVVYIEFFRATPMIVQAMLIYYGLGFAGINIPELPAGLLVISINTGAYMAEIVRGGILSIDKGQTEGAQSIGMTHWQTMTTVVLPQAIRNIMPALGNEFVINIKDGAVLSVIGVTELFFQTKSAAGTYAQYFPAFAITCVIYLIMTVAITRLLMVLEKKMDGPASYVVKEALKKRST